jgi:hypothetical protein
MSGTVAAHAAYNGSGTQGLAVTNTMRAMDGTGRSADPPHSVFWNNNDKMKQLVYGSTFVEVPTSGGSGTNLLSSPNHQIFDVSNDLDCLGDMILKITVTNSSGGNATPNAQEIAQVVSRVEIRVGNQTWQTIEGADLQALAATELSRGSFDDYSFQTSGGVSSAGLYHAGVPDAIVVGNNAAVVAFFPLKVFTKTLAPRLETFSEQSESGYLMAAAPRQSVTVKVFTAGGALSAFDGTVDLALYAQNMVMCQAERAKLKTVPNGIAKRIKMTQNQSKNSIADPTTMELDLDHFSLYASHLIISFGGVATDALDGVNEAKLRDAQVELLLNSTSFSGKLPLGLLKLSGSSNGLHSHQNRGVGEGNLAAVGDDKAAIHTFVFPLASRAYGGSSVPLNRFDNIRLKITNLGGSGGAALNTTTVVSVTCVGETTALYKNDTASLAMY